MQRFTSFIHFLRDKKVLTQYDPDYVDMNIHTVKYIKSKVMNSGIDRFAQLQKGFLEISIPRNQCNQKVCVYFNEVQQMCFSFIDSIVDEKRQYTRMGECVLTPGENTPESYEKIYREIVQFFDSSKVRQLNEEYVKFVTVLCNLYGFKYAVSEGNINNACIYVYSGGKCYVKIHYGIYNYKNIAELMYVVLDTDELKVTSRYITDDVINAPESWIHILTAGKKETIPRIEVARVKNTQTLKDHLTTEYKDVLQYLNDFCCVFRFKIEVVCKTNTEISVVIKSISYSDSVDVDKIRFDMNLVKKNSHDNLKYTLTCKGTDPKILDFDTDLTSDVINKRDSWAGQLCTANYGLNYIDISQCILQYRNLLTLKSKISRILRELYGEQYHCAFYIEVSQRNLKLNALLRIYHNQIVMFEMEQTKVNVLKYEDITYNFTNENITRQITALLTSEIDLYHHRSNVLYEIREYMTDVLDVIFPRRKRISKLMHINCENEFQFTLQQMSKHIYKFQDKQYDVTSGLHEIKEDIAQIIAELD